MLKYTLAGAMFGKKQVLLDDFLAELCAQYPGLVLWANSRRPLTEDNLRVALQDAGLETIVSFEMDELDNWRVVPKTNP